MGQQLGAQSVLVLEDDPALSRILEMLLHRVGGWTVRCVSTLSEALIAAKRESPDFYLLDLYVPDGLGTGILDAMDAGELEKKTVILLSAATHNPAQLATLNAQRAQGVLAKPFDSSKLLSQIRSILTEFDKGKS